MGSSRRLDFPQHPVHQLESAVWQVLHLPKHLYITAAKLLLPVCHEYSSSWQVECDMHLEAQLQTLPSHRLQVWLQLLSAHVSFLHQDQVHLQAISNSPTTSGVPHCLCKCYVVVCRVKALPTADQLGLLCSLPPEWGASPESGLNSINNISLASNKLTGTLPSWNGSGLIAIRSLDVSSNDLTGALLPHLVGIPSCQALT